MGDSGPTKKLTEEEAFREHLDDACLVIQRLAPLCQTFDEMIGMIRHATGTDGQPGNDAQLRLLLKMTTVNRK